MCGIMMRLVFADHAVDVLDERITIHAMNHAGLFDAFSARSGTAKAVHPHAKEKLRRLRMVVKHITNDGFSIYLHLFCPSFPLL